MSHRLSNKRFSVNNLNMNENQAMSEIRDPTLAKENTFMTSNTETYHNCSSCCKNFRLLSGLKGIDEPPVKKKKTANKASEPGSDESDDEKSPKKAVKKSSGPRKSPFSAEMKLCPTLASVMGTDSMRRSDVVKQMWEIIKERGLQDPINRKFMLCDDELLPLFGKKRVKTFGMMKYLSEHIFKPEDYEQMFTMQ